MSKFKCKTCGYTGHMVTADGYKKCDACQSLEPKTMREIKPIPGATVEETKPSLIAYTNGLEIIPFDNVIFVSESSSTTGGLFVMTKNKTEMIIPASDAEEFIDRYNLYLLAIEKAFVGSVEE